MNSKRALAIALLAWIALVASAGADIGTDLKQADRYLRRGQGQKSLEIYEALYLQHPNDEQVINGLRNVYRETGNWDKLVTLLRVEMARKPSDVKVRRELGDALYYTDHVQEARETWESIIDAAPQESSSYEVVAEAYMEKGLTEDAVAVYQRGKKALKDQGLFAMELANIHRVRRNFDQAAQELLLYLQGDPERRFRKVHEAFISYVREDDEAWMPVIQVVRDQARAAPDDVGLIRLAGDILLEGGHPADALKFYQRIDRLEDDGEGKSMLLFASTCDESGFHQTALEANRYLLETYTQEETRAAATLGLARALRGLGQFNESIEHYRALTEEGKNRIEATFQIAEIYLHDLGEVGRASELYKELLEGHPQSRRAPLAALRLGDCHILKGDLEIAREIYNKVGELGRDGNELREEARYKMAEIRYFQGNFDESAQQFDKLAELYPQGLYVNDALDHALIIEEGLESKRVLAMFAHAQLMVRQGKLDEALREYQEILEQPEAILMDRTLFRLAELKHRMGRHQEAVDICQQLISTYPDSPLCDHAYVMIGRIYEDGMKDTERAVQQYKAFLADYPQSLLLSHVRARIRELQGE